MDEGIERQKIFWRGKIGWVEDNFLAGYEFCVEMEFKRAATVTLKVLNLVLNFN